MGHNSRIHRKINFQNNEKTVKNAKFSLKTRIFRLGMGSAMYIRENRRMI